MSTTAKWTRSGPMMGKRRKRRFWSDAEKVEICRQTSVPGVSVSRVARRYDVNANQVFNWLKDPRFKPNSPPPEAEAPVFLPVEVVPDAEPELTRAVDREGAIEVLLSNGRRLRLTGAFDVDIVARLARRLDA
mgnify:CR=1 FL=1